MHKMAGRYLRLNRAVKGGSGRELQDPLKLHVTNFDKYREMIKRHLLQASLTLNANRGKPFILVAHSMMGAASIPSLQNNTLDIDGFVALAPMV